MSNIKEVHYKLRLHALINLLSGVWLPCCATLSSLCICTHKQYIASHDNHEKNLFMGFLFFPNYMSMVVCLVSLQASRAPLKKNYKIWDNSNFAWRYLFSLPPLPSPHQENINNNNQGFQIEKSSRRKI